MRLHSPRSVLMLVGMALPLLSFGAVYKWVGPDGQVIYSDQPQPGATEVELPKFPVAAPAPAPVTSPTTAPSTSVPQGEAKKPAPPFSGYRTLSIVKPENDATVRENTGNVRVELATEPEWDPQRGHKVSVLLDGTPMPETYTATTIDLHNVDRGSHTLQVTVLDATGAVLTTSQTVTIHLKRHSVQFARESPRMAPHFNPASHPHPLAP